MADAPVPEDPAFEALLDYIRTNRGFDFTGYKRQSLKRRFEKRMQAHRIERPEEYERYLEEHPDEFIDLFNTILINVTGFFRDAPAWEYLQAEVVPKIIEARSPDAGLRVWSTGCASGEEAYTLAIVFAEVLGIDGFKDRVKIYATDVDEEALTEGRHAIYPVKRVEHLPDEIVKKYFERVEQHYTFRADLRRSVIFGRHDLVKDPPISKIDLLASRNTLMYFTPDAQTRILAGFHFALQPDGYLFLGKSEVLLSRSTLFTPVDMKRRIFSPTPSGAMRPLLTPVPRGAPPPAAVEEDALRDTSFEVSAVAQVIVDASGHLAQANHQARVLFKLDRRDLGRPLQDLEISYRPVELRSRIEQVHNERHAIALRNVEWRDEKGVERFYDVTLTPLIQQNLAPGTIRGVNVTFTEVTRYKVLQTELESSKRDAETAYEELQSTVEELETTNEELQSTNEELETTNEELQSTNEELETMNEELQSTNEELETINDELSQRTDEVNAVNAFLESILTSIEGGVVVVDRELRVTAWNYGAEQLWGLRSEEAQGQHLLNLDIGLPTSELRVPLRKAMSDGGTSSEVVVDAINRRGKTIRCKVLCSPLHLNGITQGAILLMEDART